MGPKVKPKNRVRKSSKEENLGCYLTVHLSETGRAKTNMLTYFETKRIDASDDINYLSVTPRIHR